MLQGFFGADVPGVEQVQIGPLVGHVLLVGQTRHRVFGREAGDVVGGLNRLAHRSGGEVRGRGIAALVAQVHRHAQRLVAVALHVFQLALAHRNAQARALRHLGPRVHRTQLARMAQRQIGQLLKLASRVLKTRQRL